MRNELIIEAVENGFIVKVHSDNVVHKIFAFESPDAMAGMAAEWGVGVTGGPSAEVVNEQ